MARNATNKFLQKAKKSKSDEFYTQYSDIQKEVEAYLEYNPDVFRDRSFNGRYRICFLNGIKLYKTSVN